MGKCKNHIARIVLQHRRSGKHQPLFAANRVHFVRENEAESEKEKEVIHEHFLGKTVGESINSAGQQNNLRRTLLTSVESSAYFLIYVI